jgi:hypothetical protein
MTRSFGFSYRRKFEELSRNSFRRFDGIAEVEFLVGIATGGMQGEKPFGFSQDKISSPEILVRETGVEPARPFGHKILSLARLPVPPLPQWWLYSTSLRRAAPLRFYKGF